MSCVAERPTQSVTEDVETAAIRRLLMARRIRVNRCQGMVEGRRVIRKVGVNDPPRLRRLL